MDKAEIAVIGGGASGMVAAIVAARNGCKVTVYEKNDRIGKKILATGNGRCNMTNIYANKDRFHGNDIEFMSDVMNCFWVDETLDFFSELGLVYKTEEEGKVYPYSNHAASVLDVLRFELDRLGVVIKAGFEVKEIKRLKKGFNIFSYNSECGYADRVIVSTGGKASPSSGSNGSGYTLLEGFGHKLTRIFPSLVQVKLKTTELKQLNGLKIDGNITVKKGREVLRKESGEILFTDYGISGPPVFAVSRIPSELKECTIEIDFMPEFSFMDIVKILEEHRKIMNTVEELFVGVLNRRIGQMLIKSVTELKMNEKIKNVTDKDIKKIAEKLKSFTIITDGTMSWNNAQVTAGGVETRGFNGKTMESKLVKGLYCTGEILDIDGDCGGFNLQWAWSSGYIAGVNAAKGEWL